MTTLPTPHVAIIGGGLSGLYAAYLLQQQDIQVTLYEARDRLGGRIVSLPSSQPSADIDTKVERFDLGPSWFWPDMHPLITQLVEELNLTAFQQYQTGAHLFDRGRGNPPQRYELGFGGSPVSMRLAGGMLSLIEALAKHLKPDTVKLSHTATKISQNSDDTLSLSFETPEGQTNITADHVILALPLRLLANNISFTPALPDALLKHCQDTMTWMAAHAKFVAVYEQPFWRQQGLAGSVSSQTGPLVEIHDACAMEGKAALFGFVGVNAAARKTAGKETLIQVTLNQLAALFGEQAANPIDAFLIDWSQEKFTATEPDQVGANSHPLYGLPDSSNALWNNRLHVSGTESSANAGGYLEGALDSALTTTSRLLS